MLKMRLQRTGRTNDPSFRIVVLEGTEGPKSGNHVDQIGFYNAVTKEKALDTEKAKHWLSKGVQPSDTVYNMLVTAGVIEGKKKNVLPKKTPIVKEAPAVAEPLADKPVASEVTPAVQASEPVIEAKVADEAPEASVEVAPEVVEAPEAGEAKVADEATPAAEATS